MQASVTIDHGAFGDARVKYLGELAGYNAYEALGRMASLWSRCTWLQTDQPGVVEIRACLGQRGDEWLVEAGLGEVLPDATVRVKGCSGRTEWYSTVAERNVKGGLARAKNAQRDQRGRLLPAGSAGDAGDRLAVAGPASPASIQPPPASEPDVPDTALSLDRGPLQLPERGQRDLVQPPSDRGALQAAAAKVPPAPPLHERAVCDVAPKPGRGASVPDPRSRINHEAWTYGAARHAELGRLGVDPQAIPWAAMPSGHGKDELVARTRELTEGNSPDFEKAMRDHRRVVDVAFERARDLKSRKFFTPSWMFEKESFWKSVEAHPSQAKAKPIGAPPSSPAKFDPLPPRVEVSEEERVEMTRMANAIAADPQAAARGAKP